MLLQCWTYPLHDSCCLSAAMCCQFHCRSASLSVTTTHEGTITQGGQRPLGLVFPAVAIGPSGQLLVVFTAAGPGNATASAPAYPGEMLLPTAGAAEQAQCHFGSMKSWLLSCGAIVLLYSRQKLCSISSCSRFFLYF
jgi:hypothetical protein